jgi:hypothetical protein
VVVWSGLKWWKPVGWEGSKGQNPEAFREEARRELWIQPCGYAVQCHLACPTCPDHPVPTHSKPFMPRLGPDHSSALPLPSLASAPFHAYPGLLRFLTEALLLQRALAIPGPF